MLKIKPAIIIPAFDRDDCLGELLTKINSSNYPSDDIDLVISIDKSWNPAVRKIAEEFQWTQGNKRIVFHDKHLGLKDHIVYCGNLTKEYGAIIIIEDDVILSKEYYKFAASALKYYKNDKNIASISLTGFVFDEFAIRQFYPLDDGCDTYFTNTAATWAYTWTKRSWKEFSKWYAKKIEANESKFNGLPKEVKAWSENSFKKYLNLYLLEKNNYFVIPRKNYAVNTGKIGTHYQNENLNFSAPLVINNADIKFSPLKNSHAVYDEFLELETQILRKLNPELMNYDFAVDLKGIKDKSDIRKDLILTNRKCINPIKSYGLKLLPFEMNIIENIKGDHFNLCKVEDCSFEEIENEKTVRELSILHKLYALNVTDETIVSARKLKF